MLASRSMALSGAGVGADDAKQPCRLCYYDSDDTVSIFGETGRSADYADKIAKYLYLRVGSADRLPQVVCWMCAQHLVTFDQFYAKINHIQRVRLRERYDELVIGRPDASAEKNGVEAPPPEAAEAVAVAVKGATKTATARRTRSSVRLSGATVGESDTKEENGDEEKPVQDVVVDNGNGAKDDDDDDDNDDDDDDGIPLQKILDNSKAKRSTRQSAPDPKYARALKDSATSVAAVAKRRGRPPKCEAPAAKRSRLVAGKTERTAPVKQRKADVQPDEKQADERPETDDEAEPSQHSEGESDDDFPNASGRDGDASGGKLEFEFDLMVRTGNDDDYDDDDSNDAGSNANGDVHTDWATLMAQGKFPNEILKDGLLLIKGDRLMAIINKCVCAPSD